MGNRNFHKRDLSSFQKEMFHEEIMVERITETKKKISRKKKNLYLVLVMSLFFVGVFTLVLNRSYAFFTTQANSKNYIVYSGSFKVDFTKDSDVLSLNNTYPMSNTDGLAANDNIYTFSVTNSGTVDAKYQVRLELLKDGTKDYIPLMYIKMAYSTDGVNYSEPIRLSDLDSNLVFISNKQLTATSVDNYSLKFWVDFSAPLEVEGKTFKVQVVVDAVQSLDGDHIVSDAAPIITLNKGTNDSIDQVILVGSTYNDPGVLKIEDDNDKIDKNSVVKTYKYFNGTTLSDVSGINTANNGVYYITYAVTDGSGNIGKAERTVIVNPSETLPTIALVGNSVVTLTENDTYTEQGATVASGNRLITTGEVKTAVPGTYIIRYIVVDENNNMNSVARTVTVTAVLPAPSINLRINNAHATIKMAGAEELYGYGINQSNSVEPTYTVLNTMNSTVTWTAEEVGTYYVWVKDISGRISKREINITVLCPYQVEEQIDFAYKNSVQNFQPECDGIYKLEVWGAQGGSYSTSYVGGKGGYSYGNISLTEGTNLYVYTGGQGQTGATTGTRTGGYNGGGNSYSSSSNYGGSGGGASDIRIGQDSLYARVIVAGGGGGSGSYSTSYYYNGGYGGGTTGGNGSQYSTSYRAGTGGSQTTAGTSYYSTTSNNASYGTSAAFGTGGSSNTSYSGIAGGGGGWYGGGYAYMASAGGGSGYVYTESTASNYPSGVLLNSSNYLSFAETKAGNTSFLSPTGTSETGHTGNGYARITYLSILPLPFFPDPWAS